MTEVTDIVLPRRIVRDTRARAAIMSAGVRLGLRALAAVVGVVPLFGVISFLWVVGVVQADLSVCRESTLIANLGVPRVCVFALALPAILLPEIAWQLAGVRLLAR